MSPKNWIFLFIVLISGILQITIPDSFKVFNIKPDFLLISVVLGSLLFRPRWAFVFSIFAGILKDTFSPSPFCINTILFILWSFIILKLTRQIAIDNNFMRIGLIFIIAIIHNIITGFILIYSGSFIPLGIFLRIIFLGSLYTAVVLPLAIKIIRPVYRDLF